MSPKLALKDAVPLASIVDLPFDVLLDIFHLLRSRDLISLLCCCRHLHALVEEDSIWRNLSAAYGLRDVAPFGGRSWFTIYTRLLHPYGPMLGLWAGDRAYTGGILDVRLHPGDHKTQGGIHIDMWQFRLLQPEDIEGPEKPELPMYTPVVRIDFSATPSLYGDVQVSCCCFKKGGAPRPPPHSAALKLFSSTHQGRFLHSRQGQYLHPEFPGPEIRRALDEGRYPVLRCRRTTVADQTSQLTQQRPRIPVVFTAPTPYRKPQAVSISCRHGCVDRMRPFLGFDDIVPFAPRYYPLRHVVPPAVDPLAPDWHPRSLVGLWLGSHGPHGTECLYLEWERASCMLRAWKITGDENVPRGALSWQVDTGSECPVRQIPACACMREQGIGDLAKYRAFGGSGTISARGFL